MEIGKNQIRMNTSTSFISRHFIYLEFFGMQKYIADIAKYPNCDDE